MVQGRFEVFKWVENTCSITKAWSVSKGNGDTKKKQEIPVYWFSILEAG